MRKATALALLLACLATAGLAGLLDRPAGGGIIADTRALLAPVFYTTDVLTEPGRAVRLEVSLRGDLYLKATEGKRVQFLLEDKIIGEVKTDSHGIAAIAWRVPPKANDYVIQVQVRAEDQPSTIIPPADLLVAARKADTPMIAVDLDKTVVASGFSQVLRGNAEPMAGASDVLTRVATTQTVIYLTQRPDLLGPQSKKWLADHNFPRGPMLTSSLTQLAEGSEASKSARLADLRKTYKNLAIGIGDKVSDAQAYADNGLKPIMILSVNWADPSPETFEKLSKELIAVPQSAQVVASWAEISEVLFEKAERPKKMMEDRLLDAAKKLRAKKKG